MDQVTARFKDQLFNSPNEIRIVDQLAEWNRQHLDARYASAQLYNPKSKHLRVVAQREFARALIGQFHDMPLTSGTMCARAARLRTPILVPDVTADSDWTPFLGFSDAAGFGASGTSLGESNQDERESDGAFVQAFGRPGAGNVLISSASL